MRKLSFPKNKTNCPVQELHRGIALINPLIVSVKAINVLFTDLPPGTKCELIIFISYVCLDDS